MSKNTAIQWADSTINPVMGCDGCELWPTQGQLRLTSNLYLLKHFTEISPGFIKEVLSRRDWTHPTNVYHRRLVLAEEILTDLNLGGPEKRHIEGLAKALSAQFKCYAGILHLRHATNKTKPAKYVNPGYAPVFERPTKFAGRMLSAARWKDLRGQDRIEAPWKDGLPRLVFISDMADALFGGVDSNSLNKRSSPM